MAVSYSISDIINYDLVGIGIEDPLTSFPAIYGNGSFGYTVTFTLDTGVPITEVTVLSSPTYTNEVILSPNSIRITRDITQNIFPNEQYSFAEFDSNFSKTIVVLPPEETSQASLNASVFKWDTPSQSVASSLYTFSISSINTAIVPNVTETVTQSYTQDLVWSIIPGTQALIELVSRSKY